MINEAQAKIIAQEALEFMAKKAGVEVSEILAAMQAGEEKVINYFVQLLEIGGRQVAKMA